MRLLARDLTEKALALVLGLFLLLALFRGGNTDLALQFAVGGGIALLALAVSLVLLAAPALPVPSAATVIYGAALLLLLLTGMIGLTSVSSDLWLRLPGRADYGNVVALLTRPEFAVDRLALSVDPYGTKRALLALVPCVAIVIASNLLSRRSLLRVLGVLAVLATFEALVGLFQLGFRGASAFVLEYAGHNRASGTFVNKNHYATLLAMALPLLIFRAAGQFSFFSHRHNASALSNTWWGVAAAFVAAALVASLSRAGVLAGGIVTAAAILLCVLQQQSRSRRVLAFVLALVALTVALAAMTGLEQLLKSVTNGGLGDGASTRSLMNAHTWNGITTFFPLGAGLGSYSIAFQRFQTPQLLGFIEYAHNDYLQLIFETGLTGIVILALLAVATGLAARTLWQTRVPDERLSPALPCFLGALAFAIHAWFDFPSHIPGTAIVATLLFAASMNAELIAVGRRRAVGESGGDAPMLRVTRRAPAAMPAPELMS